MSKSVFGTFQMNWLVSLVPLLWICCNFDRTHGKFYQISDKFPSVFGTFQTNYSEYLESLLSICWKCWTHLVLSNFQENMSEEFMFWSSAELWLRVMLLRVLAHSRRRVFHHCILHLGSLRALNESRQPCTFGVLKDEGFHEVIAVVTVSKAVDHGVHTAVQQRQALRKMQRHKKAVLWTAAQREHT